MALSADEQQILNSFLNRLTEGLDEDAARLVQQRIEANDLTSLASAIDSLNHTAPEARYVPMRDLFDGLDLGGILMGVGLGQGEIVNTINRIAGVEVVRSGLKDERE